MKSFGASAENLHFGFLALSHFAKQHNGALPRPGNKDDAAEVVAIAERLFAMTRAQLVPGAPVSRMQGDVTLEEINKDLIEKLALYSAGNLNPMVCVRISDLLSMSLTLIPCRHRFWEL